MTAGSVLVQFLYAQVVAPGKYRHASKGMIAQNGVIQGSSGALFNRYLGGYSWFGGVNYLQS